MPKRGAIALALTALALVLLLSFQTPADIGTMAGGAARSGGVSITGNATLDGPAVNTRFGPVQVEVVVANGHITDLVALQLPNGDRRSASISSRVEGTLRSQALAAQGANIDGVSGATYTSIAYARSLQAALDGAGG